MSHNLCQETGQHVCQQPSGRQCIEPGCTESAGTWWTHLWCPGHDQERLDRITAQLEDLASSWSRP